MVTAALGSGSFLMRALKLHNEMFCAQFIVFSFTIGIGIIGWTLFFPGIFGQYNIAIISVILLIFSSGVFVIFRNEWPKPASKNTPLFEYFLYFVLAVIIFLDVAEALSPPADADTMAYHFETPRQYLLKERIFPIPRAVDGITQLLLQMTYAPPLALGGERAVNFWTMLSGWGLAAMFFVLARLHISQIAALIGTLILLSTPAIVYSGGTGQVEVRIATFVLLGIYATIQSFKSKNSISKNIKWTALAGIMAGFCAGSKLTGLIFVFSVATTILLTRPNALRLLVFSACAILVGCQWYIFNWFHTGDPIYPILWEYLNLNPNYLWNKHFAETNAHMFLGSGPDGTLPRNLVWFFSYPFRTIIAPSPFFESLRTGLGPAVLVGLPFVIGYFLFYQKNNPKAAIKPIFLILFLFYCIWFFFGPSLRIRHLLPIYPMVLLIVVYGCVKFTVHNPEMKRLLLMGSLSVLFIQIAGQALFTKKYLEYILSRETRVEFLQKNIAGYDAIRWINQNLSSKSRILIQNRTWSFHINVPYLLGNDLQTTIHLYQHNKNYEKILQQINSANITHIAIEKELVTSNNINTLGRFIHSLQQNNCLTLIQTISGSKTRSRTLPSWQNAEFFVQIYKINIKEC